MDRAQALLDRYGSYALCISYFLPVVRHVVPYLVGIGKMTFRRYALFSYTTGLVWTLVLFFAGNLMGNNVENLSAFVGMFNQTMVVTAAALVLLAAIGYYGYTLWKRQKSEASSARSLTVEREGNE